MRLCLLGILLSASLGAQPAPDSAPSAAARTAHVEGQVLSQAGEPLRKASVRLAHYYADRSSNAISYVDTTDAAGKFVFEDVLPGRYTLSAERTGFLPQNYGAVPLTGTAIFASRVSPRATITSTRGKILIYT